MYYAAPMSRINADVHTRLARKAPSSAPSGVGHAVVCRGPSQVPPAAATGALDQHAHDRKDRAVLALSLVTQIEEAAAFGKRLSGNIQSFDALLRPDNLAALEQAHPGRFAFLAFHPAADEAVAAYVRGGTLSDDSGDVFTLFTLDVQARWPVEIDHKSFGSWLNVEPSTHPAYHLVRMLFAPKPAPPLPGVAFFGSLSGEDEPIFASLQGLVDETAVRERLRTLFAVAQGAFDRRGRPTAKALAVALEQRRLPFERGGRTSMRQWLIRTLRYLDENKGDLVSAVGLFA